MKTVLFTSICVFHKFSQYWDAICPQKNLKNAIKITKILSTIENEKKNSGLFYCKSHKYFYLRKSILILIT